MTSKPRADDDVTQRCAAIQARVEQSRELAAQCDGDYYQDFAALPLRKLSTDVDWLLALVAQQREEIAKLRARENAPNEVIETLMQERGILLNEVEALRCFASEALNADPRLEPLHDLWLATLKDKP